MLPVGFKNSSGLMGPEPIVDETLRGQLTGQMASHLPYFLVQSPER